ncbi:MAG: hypothetical protein M3R36_17410 [Bacteroidota bacterium]|nr:hypothetical protein [Bacteroidota bacterium]
MYQNNLYDILLDKVIKNKYNDLIINYLKELKPKVETLRRSYRNFPSHIDYNDYDLQMAYLFTYFPAHAQIIYDVLKKCDRETIEGVFEKNRIFACFIGSGPSPETFGMLNFLDENYKNVNCLNINVFDLNYDTWKLSHNILKDIANQNFGKLEVEISGVNIDISKELEMQNNISEIINNADVITMQNCLTEISENDYGKIIFNIEIILDSIKHNSIFIISDFSEYQKVNELLSKIEITFASKNNIKILRSANDGKIEIDLNSIKPNEIILGNLLTSEEYLIPKSHLSFQGIVFKKFDEKNKENKNEIKETDIEFPNDKPIVKDFFLLVKSRLNETSIIINDLKIHNQGWQSTYKFLKNDLVACIDFYFNKKKQVRSNIQNSSGYSKELSNQILSLIKD